MRRLTTRNSMGVAVYKTPCGCENCDEPIYRLPDCGNGSPTDKLAEYEDAEEQGYLLRLPCAKNETVWCITYDTTHTRAGVFEATIDELTWSSDDGLKIFVRFTENTQPHPTYTFFLQDIGKRLFTGENAKENATKEYARTM